jgi:hypothetical protein
MGPSGEMTGVAIIEAREASAATTAQPQTARHAIYF